MHRTLNPEFSYRTRQEAIDRFRNERFDLLIVGGGITGVAVARDAASRGFKVALIEKGDFASGTSSRSSKLIHGGLRYLQNFEWSLVFEALAERALLMKTAPHLVHPLRFYLPVYQGDRVGRALLSLGLWLYDLLALFRAPGMHRYLSKRRFLECFPGLRGEGLRGGFQYYDAAMWDDVLTVETARSARRIGASCANYVEAVRPIREGDRIAGFYVRDREAADTEEFALRASQVVICAGPWTDLLGERLTAGSWRDWLKPSKGIHLVFDAKRLPIPGAMVMTNPDDGRIAFLIPRPDFGQGVVIVGTTDAPTPKDPDRAVIEPDDVEYLMELLRKYFPGLDISDSDILSAYVGVRPLMDPERGGHGDAASLQKVSREHFIGEGPGGVVMVAGGKYTTHRTMAREIVDETIQVWLRDFEAGRLKDPIPPFVPTPATRLPVNETALQVVSADTPAALRVRYGGEAEEVVRISKELRREDVGSEGVELEGFPLLEAQLRHQIRFGMVVHLEDFYLRRTALYLARADHGLPLAEHLARIWAEETGASGEAAFAEIERLEREIGRRESWRTR